MAALRAERMRRKPESLGDCVAFGFLVSGPLFLDCCYIGPLRNERGTGACLSNRGPSPTSPWGQKRTSVNRLWLRQTSPPLPATRVRQSKRRPRWLPRQVALHSRIVSRPDGKSKKKAKRSHGVVPNSLHGNTGRTFTAL